jgi:hypothetical protein
VLSDRFKIFVCHDQSECQYSSPGSKCFEVHYTSYNMRYLHARAQCDTCTSQSSVLMERLRTPLFLSCKTIYLFASGSRLAGCSLGSCLATSSTDGVSYNLEYHVKIGCSVLETALNLEVTWKPSYQKLRKAMLLKRFSKDAVKKNCA